MHISLTNLQWSNTIYLSTISKWHLSLLNKIYGHPHSIWCRSRIHGWYFCHFLYPSQSPSIYRLVVPLVWLFVCPCVYLRRLSSLFLVFDQTYMSFCASLCSSVCMSFSLSACPFVRPEYCLHCWPIYWNIFFSLDRDWWCVLIGFCPRLTVHIIRCTARRLPMRNNKRRLLPAGYQSRSLGRCPRLI